MFDLSGKFSEFKDKIKGKKRAEKEEIPAPLTDQNYIRDAAGLMRRIVDNSRVDIIGGRTDEKETLAAYCYGALAEFDRDHGEKAELLHGTMHHMLTRKFHFPESYALQLIKQIQSAREHGGNERLSRMIRQGEEYYEMLRGGREHSAAEEAEAAFCLSLFEAKDDVYIAPPGDERIREFEEAHGIKFPDEYIRFLKEYNGAVPVKGGIDCCGVIYYVERFLPLLDKAGLAEMRLVEGRETVEKLLPLEMDAVIRQYADRITDDLDLSEMYYIPIAKLSGGNLACLDFGVYPAPPTVCIWREDESNDLYPVLVEAAECFAGFLNQLYLIQAAADQEQDAFCREYFAMADSFAELAGLCLETAREEERQIFAAYCFGALYSYSRERGVELFQVQTADIALLVQKFGYSPQESAQMFGVFVQVAGGDDESLAKEAIRRGMVDFYVLKGGEKGLVERNLEELLRSARELMED